MAQNFVKGVSPRGVFVFPHLNTPDTKFKDEGEYHVKLRLSADDPATQALMQLCDREAAKALEEAQAGESSPAKRKRWETKYLPYEMEEDEDGEETGNVLFKFKSRASGVVKKTGKAWSRKIKLFDAKLNPINEEIWGGTEGKVSFEVMPYAPTTQVGASVSLSIVGVQVLKLVTGGGADPEGMGFDEEDGFEGEEKATNEEGFSEEADDDDGSGDF